MSNEVTCHFKLLTRHNPKDEEEPRRYSCSECDNDIFSVNTHAQFAHDTLVFDIDGEEENRKHAHPTATCGVKGCKFDAHSEGPHSWQLPGGGK